VRSNIFLYIIFATAGILVGWLLFNPNFSGMIEYMIVLISFVMLAWIIIVSFVHDEKEKRYLLSIFIFALLLRILVSMLIHNLLPPGWFAPDEPGILYNGMRIAEYWSGTSSLYIKVNGVRFFAASVFYLFGYKPDILFLFVNFLGALTVLNIYFITRRLFNEQSAKYSSLIIAVLPSIVLWTSLPLKDPYSAFFISSIIHLTLRVKERFRINNVLLIIFLIAMVGFVRSYLLFIVLLAVGFVFIPYRKETFLKNIIVTFIIAIAFAAILSSHEARNVPTYKSESAFQTLQQTRKGFYQGGSKILGNIDVSNPVNAFMYLPSMFFLAPFPWDITGSMIHNLATAEGLIWYYFFYYAIKGIIRSLKDGNFDTIPVLVIIAVLSTAYALAITNLGAMYRFRAQVSIFMIVFTGYGLYLRHEQKVAAANSEEKERRDSG